MSCFTAYFLRHCQSTYSNIYPDLTEQGIVQANKAGIKLKEKLAKSSFEKLSLIRSPAVRAQGTVDLIANCIGFSGEIKKEPLLADMTIYDHPKAMAIFSKASKEHGRIENVYDLDPVFEDSSIFEPRSIIRQRFYTFLGRLIANIKQNDGKMLIAVSHFEIINHFIQKLWPGTSPVDYADMLKFQFFSDDYSDLVDIKIEFGERKDSYVSSFILGR